MRIGRFYAELQLRVPTLSWHLAFGFMPFPNAAVGYPGRRAYQLYLILGTECHSIIFTWRKKR